MSGSYSSKSSKQPPASPSCCQQTNSLCAETNSTKSEKRKGKSFAKKYHFNSIWSLWYCVVVTAFTSYLVYSGIQRFLKYASLPWPNDKEPFMELNAHVGLVGAAIVVLPFFVVASVIKVGNLPNDGFKLGSSLSTCSRDPPSVLQPSSGVIRNLWLHGVPTSPFLHLIAAFCLLLPQTLMGGALIRARFVPQDEVWRSDLNVFVGVHGVNTSGEPRLILNVTALGSTSPLPDHPPVVLIQGTKTPTLNYSYVSQSPWRIKRSSRDLYESPREAYIPEMEFTPTKFWTPFSTSVKLPQNKGKGEILFPFSPHQERRAPAEVRMAAKKLNSTPAYVHLSDLIWNSFSPELLNYALALLVFAVRYPSVFWHTNKRFSFLFSLHLIITGIQTTIVVAAFPILYKFQINNSRLVVGGEAVPFVSTPVSSLVLLVLAVLTLTVSSSAVYFYGYQRFASFLDRSRKRFHITYTSNPVVMRSNTTYLSALAILLCLSLSFGPLLWDFSALYRKSGGNKVLLTTVVTSIGYLVLWVLFWIYLSLKCSWIFKLRVTVARAFVSSARSIKLVNDVELSRAENESVLMPILVVGNGRAVAIKDAAPKRAIMGVVNKIKAEKKSKGQEEEIYWLRPSFNSSFDRDKLTGKTQPKVTFNDTVEEKYSAGKQLPESDGDEDDEAGDYAILKESFYPPGNESEMSSTADSDKNQPSPEIQDPRYVDRNQMLLYHKEASVTSSTDSSPILVAPDYEDTDHLENIPIQGPPSRHQIFLDAQGSVTPRSTRSNDSGMPMETPSQRSDSLSSTSSNTPPENSEESGVHSGVLDTPRNKSTSDEDLTQLPHDPRQPLLPHGASTAIVADRQGLTRHPRIAAPMSADATVAIRRHPHLMPEMRPPADPIYDTRKVTSFTPSDDTHSPIPSPVPPMPPLPSLEESGVVGLFPPRHTPSHAGHARINLQQAENTYGQRGTQIPFKYPQMPLPPIPQRMMTPSNMESHRNSQGGINGRTAEQQQQQHMYPMGSLSGIYGSGRSGPVGRSSSLRYSSSHGPMPKQYTNTFPHVLPKESQYNTNV